MDKVSRRRVIVDQICSSWNGSGQVSVVLANHSGLAQHQLTVNCSAKPTAGVLQVSIRPPGAGFFIPVTKIDLTVQGSATFIFPALFDAMMLSFSTALSGGTVSARVSSVGEVFTSQEMVDDSISRRRFISSVISAWSPASAMTIDAARHSGLTQHQFTITGGTGLVQLLGRHAGDNVYSSINASTDNIDSSGSQIVFNGIYDSFKLVAVGTVTGTLNGQIDSIGTSLFYGDTIFYSSANLPISKSQQAAFNLKLNTSIPAGYIDGLKMMWNSATSISVTSGTCYIQGSSAVISFSSTLTLSGLSLAASTWYHLYGYLNAGTPAIELVTTAPAAAYSGTARSKTGDTSRRYLGSVLTDASGNIYNFQHSGDAIKYNVNVNSAPFVVLSSGRATTATVVSVSGASPVTSKTTSLLILNSDTVGAQIVYFSNAQLGSATTTSYLGFCFYGSTEVMDFPTGASQNMNYIFGATPTGACFIRVTGYIYER
jgi:hypothetical protein